MVADQSGGQPGAGMAPEQHGGQRAGNSSGGLFGISAAMDTSSKAGDIGAVSFSTGGLTFGNRGIDSRWLIGGLVLVALFAAAVLRKRKG